VTGVQTCALPIYYILETSAGLQAQQKEQLALALPSMLFEKVSWITQLPQTMNGVMIANEVMDALPVEVLKLHANDSQHGYVVWSEQKKAFDWNWQTLAEPDLQKIANQLHHSLGNRIADSGYLTEISHLMHPWLASLADSLHQGAILLLDYGYSRREYWSPQRWMGTLRAHYRQRAHQDVFWYPGLQDLTASVDFTLVAQAGYAAGLNLAGFTTQANFLLSLGILDLVDPDADVITQLKIAQQIKTLTLPDEMGENFKAIAFLKGVAGGLTGFNLRDLRMQL
jgi:SAM-dependent MidA family methyltransferase